ncbi:zona pellucida-like domain-containing protein 1 [Brachyhypopomus gauderio]|uniref:zona pellucida-like domain-containing protein 1 n=1 Tax=Brachyhypopomus gauderio TaxID=698409 RepID=UPI004041E6D8
MLLQLIFISITANAVSGQLTADICAPYMRKPEITDIAVDCGTTYIELAIQVCPVAYTGYNESQLILNNIVGDPTCEGTLDLSAVPPVVRFRFPINSTHACGSSLQTISSVGTGVMSDISSIQLMNVSGVVQSYDTTTGTVTYNAELKYYYSCAYPLEYLINNTQMDVSSNAIAVVNNNGSFISTLRMQLFSDANFTNPLIFPYLGIPLRTVIFVQVTAINLTTQYLVLLDRCFASASFIPGNSTIYNLFLPCSKDFMTNVIENGVSQRARFSFPAFRFTEQKNQIVSTYYLHCITRLCEQAVCSSYTLCLNGRKRRAADSSRLTDPTTLTSPPIITNVETSTVSSTSSSSVGLGVAVGSLVLLSIVFFSIAAVYSRRLILSSTSKMLRS